MWWKWLSILLLLYTFAAGLLIPLGPGIRSANPAVVKAGQSTELSLDFVKANYTADIQAKKLQVRLRLNAEQAVCISEYRLNDQGQLLVQLALPQGPLPLDLAPRGNKKSPFPLLEVLGEQGGYCSMQSALFIQQDSSQGSAKSEGLCAASPWQANTGRTYPFLNILEETIRNLFFHVPMWFGMMILLFASMWYSIKHLRQGPGRHTADHYAFSLASVGLLFGLLGLVTGALWAKNTWGAYWSWDVKQNTSAVAVLIYLAYFVLRSSIEDEDAKARIAAIYNIFAFATLIPLLYIVPRLTDSLHPGMGGNPAFSSYDLDSTMRLVFYPAILGWTLLGAWMASIQIRLLILAERRLEA